MQDFKIAADGKLLITPSETSSQHDFDFYVGTWKIRNRKLNSRLTGSDEWTEFNSDQQMKIILNGLGNIDDFRATFDGKHFEGMNLRIFNPTTRLWSMYWSDTNSAALQTPTVGSFDGNIGLFFDRDTWDGQDIIVKFKWDKTDPDNPVWSQAFSTDEGKSWEWNWYMYISRVK